MKQVLGMAKVGWVLGLVAAAGMVSVAGAQSEEHGRKWKPLPPTAHIVVTVLKGFNGKPLPNAAVIFHAVREGKNDGNLEVKTNPEGQAIIDVIEQGSQVTVQVIASGFATVAQQLDVDGPSKELEIKLQRPRAQVSEYVDNDGKPAEVKPGVQEPVHAVQPTTVAPPLAKPAGTPKDPTQPTAVQPQGPLNAPPGAVTIPVQPGAPLPVGPTTTTDPATPPSTGSAQTGIAAVNEIKPLAGKRALVTGGAKRIGRAIALSLAEAGADVAITFRGSAADAEKTVADLRGLGVRALAVSCDVREEPSVQAAVAEVVGALGGIDLLINNAGAFQTVALEEISVEEWDSMFAINTRGPFLVAKAAHAELKKARGRIVNLGSLGGIHPWATHAHYCTSKAALHMLSHTMAKAWAPEISVNCVAPGMIVMGEVNPAYEHFALKTPMQRNGTAEDVAEAVLFFATGPFLLRGRWWRWMVGWDFKSRD